MLGKGAMKHWSSLFLVGQDEGVDQSGEADSMGLLTRLMRASREIKKT